MVLVFLTVFPVKDAYEEAFLPTLRTLFDAPVTSPLAEIDAEDVGLFFIQLTREDFLQVKKKIAKIIILFF